MFLGSSFVKSRANSSSCSKTADHELSRLLLSLFLSMSVQLTLIVHLPRQLVLKKYSEDLSHRTGDIMMSMRVPKRFLGMLDLPYLKAGIRDFKAIWGRVSGLKVCAGCRMPKISIRTTLLGKNLSRDYSIEVPCWRPRVP